MVGGGYGVLSYRFLSLSLSLLVKRVGWDEWYEEIHGHDELRGT